MKKEILNNIKRVVIKVGTSSLTNNDGIIDVDKINNLVKQIAQLNKDGYEVVFVSSGAIGSGNGKLGISYNTSLAQKQASAAVGQVQLMNQYEQLFSKQGVMIGQILLTKGDISNRKRNLNARNTINELLKLGIIPIINENDSIIIDEIKVGDNDNLSSQVAILVDADLLILLSDIDGIYTDNPMKNKDAKFLDIINKVDKTVLSYAKDKGSKFATGGMLTKLEAAKKANAAGIHMVIANSQREDIILDIINNNYIGSLFLADKTKMVAKKKWLLSAAPDLGHIIIDKGAANALIKGGTSLLPVGVLQVEGDFKISDTILILDEDNNIIAKGITNYCASDIDEIKGMKHNAFHNKLKDQMLKTHLLFDTIVHCDNLVLVKEDE
ncbi:MAG: glutamate 5-kinase [Erysipelotrichales bacterium]